MVGAIWGAFSLRCTNFSLTLISPFWTSTLTMAISTSIAIYSDPSNVRCLAYLPGEALMSLLTSWNGNAPRVNRICVLCSPTQLPPGRLRLPTADTFWAAWFQTSHCGSVNAFQVSEAWRYALRILTVWEASMTIPATLRRRIRFVGGIGGWKRRSTERSTSVKINFHIAGVPNHTVSGLPHICRVQRFKIYVSSGCLHGSELWNREATKSLIQKSIPELRKMPPTDGWMHDRSEFDFFGEIFCDVQILCGTTQDFAVTNAWFQGGIASPSLAVTPTNRV